MSLTDDKKMIKEAADKEYAFFCYMLKDIEKRANQTFKYQGKDVTEETRAYFKARFDMMQEFNKLEQKQIDVLREKLNER